MWPIPKLTWAPSIKPGRSATVICKTEERNREMQDVTDTTRHEALVCEPHVGKLSKHSYITRAPLSGCQGLAVRTNLKVFAQTTAMTTIQMPWWSQYLDIFLWKKTNKQTNSRARDFIVMFLEARCTCYKTLVWQIKLKCLIWYTLI